MRSIHELLVILRDNCRIRNGNVLLDGLCHEAAIMRRNDTINKKEYRLLTNYIYDNMPKRTWINKHGITIQSLWGWPQCEWTPRLQWLNEQIEKTAPATINH